jgi:hypothetical protein
MDLFLQFILKSLGSKPLVSMTKLEQAAAMKSEKEKTIKGIRIPSMFSIKSDEHKGPSIEAMLFKQLQSPTAVFLTCIGKVSGVIAYWTGYKIFIKKKYIVEQAISCIVLTPV